MIGSGVDFDSNPITIIFGVGEVSKRVNISIMTDNLLEGEESFYISLLLRNHNFQVTLRRSRTTGGSIIDSTGIAYTHKCTVLQMIVALIQASGVV